MKKSYITLILFIVTFSLNAQEIFWATKVDTVSSQYSTEEAAAFNILGKPNVDRRGRWSAYAWAVEPNRINTEGVETALIDVSFGKERLVKQLAVFESFNPGAISEIFIYDVEYRSWERVYVDTAVMAKSGYVTFDGTIDEGLKDTLGTKKKDWNLLMKDEEFQSKTGYNILNVKFDPRLISKVRIVLNLLTIDGWNQIDAVAVSNSDYTIGFPEISIADKSFITERKPKNMGDAVNTPYAEINPVLSNDGKSLYFARSFYNPKYYAETQDIYVTDYVERSELECYKKKDPLYERVDKWETASTFLTKFNNILPNEIFCFTENGNKMYLNNLYLKGKNAESDSVLNRETSGISVSKRDTVYWENISTDDIEELGKHILPGYDVLKTNKKKTVLLMTAKDSISGKSQLFVNLKLYGKWFSSPMLLGSISKKNVFPLDYAAQEESVRYRFYVDTTNKDSLKLGNIEWGKPEKVEIKGFENKSKYISVWVRPDDKVMFLALETPNGFGKRDLYVSLKNKDGNWTEPINLGAEINTLNDEASPFMDDDGVTLYFASAGHPGHGDMDIFVSRKLDDTWTNWTKPRNLGDKINTGASENMFVINPHDRVAYYSSATKAYGCNGMADLYEVQMSKPVEMLFAGKVLDVQTGNGVSKAKVTLKALDENGEEAFRAVDLVTDKFTGEFSVNLTEFVDANKLSKFALITQKDRYTQTDSKGDSIVFDVAEIDRNARKIKIDKNLYMKTIHGAGKIATIEKDEQEKVDDDGKASVDTVFVGDTVYIREIKTVTKYETVYVDNPVSGEINMPEGSVNSCDVLFHKGNLYLIPEIGNDNLVRMQYLKPSYYKEFDYNQTDFSLDEEAFVTMVQDLISKQRKFGNVTVHIVASASRIPTKAYRSNQTLAEKRYAEAIRRIKIALKRNEVSEDFVSFQEHSFVQGPKYKNDHKTFDYKQFQYVKIWLVSCDKTK